MHQISVSHIIYRFNFSLCIGIVSDSIPISASYGNRLHIGIVSDSIVHRYHIEIDYDIGIVSSSNVHPYRIELDSDIASNSIPISSQNRLFIGIVSTSIPISISGIQHCIPSSCVARAIPYRRGKTRPGTPILAPNRTNRGLFRLTNGRLTDPPSLQSPPPPPPPPPPHPKIRAKYGRSDVITRRVKRSTPIGERSVWGSTQSIERTYR